MQHRTIALASSVIALAFGAFTACGGGGAPGTGGGTTSATHSASATGTGGFSPAGGGPRCPRSLGPADHARNVLVSHPYDALGGPAASYEVLQLAADGTLTQTGATFTLGRATTGKIVFTPDGVVAIAVDEDGDLGVVAFDDANNPYVIRDKFHGSFYAGSLYVEPGGDSALVLDPNWRDNGGGIYRVRIGCDGAITDEGLVTPTKLASALAWIAGGSRAVLAAADFLASTPGDGAHLVAFDPEPAWLGGVDPFGGGNAIVSSVAATHDEAFALIADNDAFETDNRVGVVAIGPSGLAATQVLSPILDPVDVVTSPYDDAALVVSGFGNAVVALGYDPTNASVPFVVNGEIAYSGAPPQLPSAAVPIARGALEGLVLVAENLGVRRLRFETDGTITDLGLSPVGSGDDAIVGAIGVAP